MRFGVSILSIIPMRFEPSDSSEMVNQILFGEQYKILEQRKKFSRIRLSHDKYEGWICNKQVNEIDKETYKNLLSRPKKCKRTYSLFMKIVICGVLDHILICGTTVM